MKYFKVVRKTFDSKKRISSFSRGAAMVEYEVGKLATPPAWLKERGYGLTVFDNLKDAAKYAGHSYEVYTCAVMGPAREPLPIMDIGHLRNGRLQANMYTSTKWPNGTKMVDGVILMERVPTSKIWEVTEKWK